MIVVRLIGLWAPVIAFMVAILMVPVTPSLPLVTHVWDKLLHVAAYGLFGVFCLRAFHAGVEPLRWPASVLAMALTLIYAFVDEWRQSMVPGRFSSFPDWLADAIGALMALVVFALWARRYSSST